MVQKMINVLSTLSHDLLAKQNRRSSCYNSVSRSINLTRLSRLTIHEEIVIRHILSAWNCSPAIITEMKDSGLNPKPGGIVVNMRLDLEDTRSETPHIPSKISG